MRELTWQELLKAPPPLSMGGLLTFLERWQPGSTRGFKPATAGQIALLAQLYGGPAALPRVYLEFLATMGESTGSLRLKSGTTSISALLEEFHRQQPTRLERRRYLKFAIGGEDYNGRLPDDFFDLTLPTPDGRDAAIFRIHGEHLASDQAAAEQPFQTFSDWLRGVVISRTVWEALPQGKPLYYDLGPVPEAPAKAYDFLTRMGFSCTELGASAQVIPLECPKRGALALIRAATVLVPSASVRLRAREKAQQSLLAELLQDHRQELSAG